MGYTLKTVREGYEGLYMLVWMFRYEDSRYCSVKA